MSVKLKDLEVYSSMGEIIEKLQSEVKNRGLDLLHKINNISGYTMVCCPYHKDGQERKPSAQFNNENGHFWCFACHTSKSLEEVIRYCIKEDGYNWLKENFHTNDDSRDFKLFDIKPRNSKVEKLEKSIKYLERKELDKYRFIHPYILSRKISKDVIIKFELGFDKNKDCITFPIKDKKGRVLYIARRSVNNKFFNYPSGVEKPLYGEYELYKNKVSKSNSIYVTESMINCLTLWSWGYYAIALNGTGSAYQYKLLNEFPYRNLVLALDGDDAGRNGTKKLINHLKNKIVEVVKIPDGKDVNDLEKEEFDSLDREVFYVSRQKQHKRRG